MLPFKSKTVMADLLLLKSPLRQHGIILLIFDLFWLHFLPYQNC